jgi:hypothetical protein
MTADNMQVKQNQHRLVREFSQEQVLQSGTR